MSTHPRPPRKRCCRVLHAALAVALLIGLGVVTSMGVAWGCAIAAARRPAMASGLWSWVPRDCAAVVIGSSTRCFGFESANNFILSNLPPANTGFEIKADKVVMHLGTMETPEDVEFPCRMEVPVGFRRGAFHPTPQADKFNVRWTSCGWPWTAFLRFADYSPISIPVWQRRSIMVGEYRLPAAPWWPGLAADTAFYAAAWSLILFAPRRLRRTIRRRRGRCTACGYDRAGLATNAVCPECGAIPAESRTHSPSRTPASPA